MPLHSLQSRPSWRHLRSWARCPPSSTVCRVLVSICGEGRKGQTMKSINFNWTCPKRADRRVGQMNTSAERSGCSAGRNKRTKGRTRQRRAVAQGQMSREGDIPGLCVLLIVWWDGVVKRREAGETSSCRRVKINFSSLASVSRLHFYRQRIFSVPLRGHSLHDVISTGQLL